MRSNAVMAVDALRLGDGNCRNDAPCRAELGAVRGDVPMAGPGHFHKPSREWGVLLLSVCASDPLRAGAWTTKWK